MLDLKGALCMIAYFYMVAAQFGMIMRILGRVARTWREHNQRACQPSVGPDEMNLL
jgi:hypothetical protein